MNVGHVVRYHVLVPLALFVVLLSVGVPIATAFFVGMMAGCMSMMVMIGRGSRAESSDHGNSDRSGADHRSRS